MATMECTPIKTPARHLLLLDLRTKESRPVPATGRLGSSVLTPMLHRPVTAGRLVRAIELQSKAHSSPSDLNSAYPAGSTWRIFVRDFLGGARMVLVRPFRVTSIFPIFVFLIAALLAVLPVAAAVCGNSVVEPGEDC